MILFYDNSCRLSIKLNLLQYELKLVKLSYRKSVVFVWRLSFVCTTLSLEVDTYKNAINIPIGIYVKYVVITPSYSVSTPLKNHLADR